MNAINRINSQIKFESRARAIALGVKCVFISHQKKDKDAAKKIADTFIKAGVEIYFDEYDQDLKFQNQIKDPKLVTAAICKGINNSSHMLVVASANTMASTWVPFEIGYGFDKTDLSVICLKGIPKGGLPEYVRTVKVVRDLYDLNIYIEKISGKPKNLLLETKMMSDYSNKYNPLSDVMDSLINDTY